MSGGRRRKQARRYRIERQRRHDRRIGIVTSIIAPIGPLLYLVWHSGLAWWLLPLTTFPFMFWLLTRLPQTYSGGPYDGGEPFTPPDS